MSGSVVMAAVYKTHTRGGVRAEQCHAAWWAGALRHSDLATQNDWGRDEYRALAARALEAFEGAHGRAAPVPAPARRVEVPRKPSDDEEPDDDDEPEPHDPDAKPGFCFCKACLDERAKQRERARERKSETAPAPQSKTYGSGGTAMTIQWPGLDAPQATALGAARRA